MDEDLKKAIMGALFAVTRLLENANQATQELRTAFAEERAKQKAARGE